MELVETRAHLLSLLKSKEANVRERLPEIRVTQEMISRKQEVKGEGNLGMSCSRIPVQ